MKFLSTLTLVAEIEAPNEEAARAMNEDIRYAVVDSKLELITSVKPTTIMTPPSVARS